MQDYLAWRRGEKNIPPRCAVITFDDGWKSQYEVAWPIMKKYGYPLTLFIYTEGVRGGIWRRRPLPGNSQMRDTGVDIPGTHGHPPGSTRRPQCHDTEPGGKRTKRNPTGAEYEQWLQKEIVGCKQLLEQRLAIKVNCFAVPFGNYNEHVKEVARNAGYEAMFTVYGQPLTFNSPLDSLGRYAIEANKPKVFDDATKIIGLRPEGRYRRFLPSAQLMSRHSHRMATRSAWLCR